MTEEALTARRASSRPPLPSVDGGLGRAWCWFAAAIALLAAVPAAATERSRDSWPNGLTDVGIGVTMPPGVYSESIFLYYSASDFKEADGNRPVPDLDLTIVGLNSRVRWVTPLRVLGGQFLVQAAWGVAEVDNASRFFDADSGGLTDLVITPAMIGWRVGQQLHIQGGVDVNLPFGEYRDGRAANPGTNYVTVRPRLGITYLTPNGWDFSTLLMYDINFENEETNYDSGDVIHADFAVAKRIGPVLAGVAGFALKQITDDELNGAEFGENGFRGQAFGLGPVVQARVGPVILTAKVLQEFAVENRPQGHFAYARLGFRF